MFLSFLTVVFMLYPCSVVIYFKLKDVINVYC